jgi:prepilin-type N-terminal cleavage/methylation domain-containing protein
MLNTRIEMPLPCDRRAHQAKRARRDFRGFTLIEVLVAVVVIAVAFPALLALHNRNIALVGNDQDRTTATLLMRQLVAQVELLEDYARYGTSTGTFDGHPGFRYELQVDHTSIEELRQVRMRILWGTGTTQHAEVLYYVQRDPEL